MAPPRPRSSGCSAYASPELPIRSEICAIRLTMLSVAAAASSNRSPSAWENDSGEEDFSKNPFVIAFNAGYLLDCVSQIETDDIFFTFSTPSKATIAHPSTQEDNENFMELVMPVRIG